MIAGPAPTWSGPPATALPMLEKIPPDRRAHTQRRQLHRPQHALELVPGSTVSPTSRSSVFRRKSWRRTCVVKTTGRRLTSPRADFTCPPIASEK